jgi:hypothetical protein
MTGRLTTLLMVLLLFGFVIAGCGDDEGGDSNGSGTAAETVPAETATESDTDTETAEDAATDTDDSGGAAVPPAVREALDRCKQSADKLPQLSEEAREQVEAICERNASRDPEEIEKAERARAECQRLIKEALDKGEDARREAARACFEGAAGP